MYGQQYKINFAQVMNFTFKLGLFSIEQSISLYCAVEQAILLNPSDFRFFDLLIVFFSERCLFYSSIKSPFLRHNIEFLI
jgi:hypothetical protein